MEKKFLDLLSKDNYKIIKKPKEIINGPKKYVINYKIYINQYKNLFKKFGFKGNDIILDFGCGPAFSVFVGRNIFNLNVSGLDILPGSGSQDFIYGDIHDVLNIKDFVSFYDGNTINNYPDNSFSVILCFWSLLFDYSCQYGKGNYIYPNNEIGTKLLKKKLTNLVKISKPNCKWIICPPKFWNQDINNLFKEINNKNITVKLEKLIC
jgi:hypothetical protein